MVREFPMRPWCLVLFFALLVGMGWVTGPLQARAEPPVVKGLEVHVWGAFRVHNDLELANADMREIWDGLPRFVYGQSPGRTLPRHWSNVEIRDRPVLFFHAAEAVEVVLTVAFPGGMP